MLETLLIVLTVALAMLTVEVRDLLRAVVCLCGMCVTVGVMFGLLAAPYVMVFQLLIYAGAAVVLFVSVVMLTEREEQ